jgi:hypothetical protein
LAIEAFPIQKEALVKVGDSVPHNGALAEEDRWFLLIAWGATRHWCEQYRFAVLTIESRGSGEIYRTNIFR